MRHLWQSYADNLFAAMSTLQENVLSRLYDT
jgi:hypothetical protein